MKLQGSVIFAAEDFSTMERCEGKRMELRTFVVLCSKLNSDDLCVIRQVT
jgi:hypothetical protein